MAWRIYVVPSGKRAELEEVLTKDDLIWRQTRILRDAAPLGGAADEVYLYMEGSDTAMAHADEKVTSVAKKVEAALAEKLHTQFKDEEEKSAQGMGLIFSD
ncbi:MAG: hypothetical protein KGI89_11885 [Euryarchaeota archaeon]|nr:hypothetical protein [Euryarchaeota archaeon]